MTSDDFRKLPEYENHHLVKLLRDEEVGMEAFVAIHRKNHSVPSFGATRFWHYTTDVEGLRDALRLSRLMSYKAALAGLPCGGAKAVILDKANPGVQREEILSAYARSISDLRYDFITGTDVGVRQEDLLLMKRETPNIVGFNDNSTEFTSLGIYYALAPALNEVFSSPSIEGRTFAIQGLGKIGSGFIASLVGKAEKIFACDISPSAVVRIQTLYPEIVMVSPEEIHKMKVDVYAPCAMGGALNSTTIPELSCSIVVGGANNQLEHEEDGDALHARGILYAPDFVVNAGGLIAVFDEYENPTYDRNRVERKILAIGDRLASIISQSKRENRPTNRISNALAEEIFNSYA